MINGKRHSKFSPEELTTMQTLGERLCAIVDRSEGKITFAEIGRQCSVDGGKLGTYARAGRFTRTSYNRAEEWLRQFDEAAPGVILDLPAVQLELQAFGLDPGPPSLETYSGGRYDEIANLERESIY